MKVYFFLTEILGKFELPIQSCPISLAFDFKCCSMLLIVIFNKFWLSLAAVCPSGPCFASLFGSSCAQMVSKINFGFKHTVKVILSRICKSFFAGHHGLRITLGLNLLQVPWLGLVSLFQIWDFWGHFLNTKNIQKWESVIFSCDTVVLFATYD